MVTEGAYPHTGSIDIEQEKGQFGTTGLGRIQGTFCLAVALGHRQNREFEEKRRVRLYNSRRSGVYAVE
jgi:hypothetical protein